jgi:hypothetical protein
MDHKRRPGYGRLRRSILGVAHASHALDNKAPISLVQQTLGQVR